MRAYSLPALALTACLTIACGPADTGETETMSTDPDVMADRAEERATAQPAEAAVQQQFVEDMARINEAEVDLGELAAERAANPAVKAFGEELVRDHEAANERLEQVARTLSVDLPAGPDQAHQDLAGRLEDLEGAAFDREFIQAMVKGHQEAVSKLEKHVNAPELTPEVKQWASQTLESVRSHLERAEALQQQVGMRPAATQN